MVLFMRIFYRLLVLSVFLPMVSGAQVLARRGWAGSGVASEPWWQRAVFYRIQPALFQDSTGDGTGDLPGIAQRLDYIHALGVDAIVLAPPFAEDSFGDLEIAASRVHIRVLVELASPDLPRARFWLSQGAAGLVIDTPALGASPAETLRDLRHLVDSVPGNRVLIGPPVFSRPADAPQLTLAAEISAPAQVTAAGLRRELVPLREGSFSSATNPLIDLRGLPAVLPPDVSANTAARDEIVQRTLAAMAFASKAAVIFTAGRELGLQAAHGRAARIAAACRPEYAAGLH
jgi:hypothetical protein